MPPIHLPLRDGGMDWRVPLNVIVVGLVDLFAVGKHLQQDRHCRVSEHPGNGPGGFAAVDPGGQPASSRPGIGGAHRAAPVAMRNAPAWIEALFSVTNDPNVVDSAGQFVFVGGTGLYSALKGEGQESGSTNIATGMEVNDLEGDVHSD